MREKGHVAKSHPLALSHDLSSKDRRSNTQWQKP